MIIRTYFRQILLLMVIICIMGFLVQNIIVQNVYHVHLSAYQQNMNFSDWKYIVEVKETIASIRENKAGKKANVLDAFGHNVLDRSNNNNTMRKMNTNVHADEQRRLQTIRTSWKKKQTTGIETLDTEKVGVLSYDNGNKSSKNDMVNRREQSTRLSNTSILTGAKHLGISETSGSKFVHSANLTKRSESSVSNLAIASTTLPSDIQHGWTENDTHALAVFILSAIGHNSTTVSGYKWEIKLNGWEAVKHSRVKIKCCISWNNNKITQYISPNKTTRGKRLSIVGTLFSCPLKTLKGVKGVMLEYAKNKCPLDKKKYIKPFIPKLQSKRHSFAVCLKLLYGNINTKLLVDWLEFYREIKVDKIFMFVYNVTKETQSIIKHYTALGLLDTRKFDFPWKTGDPVGMKIPRFWEDEQVALYDCFHRLHGYSYVAIVDLDEFLLPRKHGNIKNMMEHLMHTHPKAAGFAMKMFVFNKDWGKSGRANGSDIVQYIQRTQALTGVIARSKNILIPSRVLVDTSFYTHEFQPKPGYESFTVPESIAAINHYRSCYSNVACDKRRRVIDTDIFKIVNRFQNRTRWHT